MAGSVEELLDLLYTEIEEAKNAPLNNDFGASLNGTGSWT